MSSTSYRTLGILTIAQAFAQCAPPVVVLLGGIVGTRLAPDPSLATMPIAFMIVGTALSTVPAALLMQRLGRKTGFMLSACSATLAGVLAAFAISIAEFWLFCLATMMIGSNNAFVQQYRFAVAESVPDTRVGQSLSILMLAGVAAAWMGPEVAERLHDVGPWGEFSGSFLGISALMVIALIMLGLYENSDLPVPQATEAHRSMFEIASQPLFLLAAGSGVAAYAIMSLIMTATPVSMHTVDHFNLEDTTWVIQSHVMAMYLPSLFSGFLIQRFGGHQIVVLGLALMFACLLVGYIDRHLIHYWGSLVLLGVGWNFLFLGGTTLLTRTYRPEERFRVQAMNDFMVFSLQACAALGSGYILLGFGWNWLLGLSVPLLLILIVLFIAAWRTGDLIPAPAKAAQG
ncbi:MAG: MFS transporter [Pseudomonadales bacterium]|nr:MFS transporter [Pseudomonadales bacterium]